MTDAFATAWTRQAHRTTVTGGFEADCDDVESSTRSHRPLLCHLGEERVGRPATGPTPEKALILAQ